MVKCEIITIGNELLHGHILNTNAQYLAEKLSAIGIDVVRQISCRDDVASIQRSLNQSFQQSRLIVMTGGLGPTPDDITREAVAQYFACGLKFHPGQYRHIVKYFKKLKKKTPFITKQEAHFPTKAVPLLNRFGIALGFYIRKREKMLIVLPGVPREMKGMYEASVKSLILKNYPERKRYHKLQARFIGLSEVKVMEKLGKSFFKGREFEFGIYPMYGEVVIRIKSMDAKTIASLKRQISQKLKKYVYSFDETCIAQVIGDTFVMKKKIISRRRELYGRSTR